MRSAFLATVLLLLIATPAFAVGGETWTYYSNSSFSTVIGARYIPIPSNPCPEDHEWWWGQTSGFKKIEYWSECYELGPAGTTCQVWNGGWQTVTCP